MPNSMDVCCDDSYLPGSRNGHLHERTILGKTIRTQPTPLKHQKAPPHIKNPKTRLKIPSLQQPFWIISVSIFQRIDSLYGVTELACWFARIMANVIEIIVIQSLYTIWKDEEMVGKRLQDLSMTAIPIPRDSFSQGYQNNAFDFPVVEPVGVGVKR